MFVTRTRSAAARDDDDAVLLDGDGARRGSRVEQVDAAGPRVFGPEPVGPRVGLRVVDSDLRERDLFFLEVYEYSGSAS